MANDLALVNPLMFRRIPHDLLTVLDQHEDEVIYLQFSHDGTMLATGSKDKTVIIWSYLKDKVEILILTNCRKICIVADI